MNIVFVKSFSLKELVINKANKQQVVSGFCDRVYPMYRLLVR